MSFHLNLARLRDAAAARVRGEAPDSCRVLREDLRAALYVIDRMEAEQTAPAAPAAPSCPTCNGHGMIGGMVHMGDNGASADAEPCPDCSAPGVSAVGQGEAQPAAFEANFPNTPLPASKFHELWDRAGELRNPRRTLLDNLRWQIGVFAGLVAQEGSAAAAAASDTRDASFYRWLKANMRPGYELPGGYYIDDEDTESWDRTIEAAKRQGNTGC
ncbi:hypothetical protein HGQ98_01750 [Achromobacter ruhlandii]|uniref:Uncharacterized protein n=1 Tax=Achromobacter ruhlandii TaxID=72557 RepID=A0A848ND70_9BURK|nr:hypothetical protein [Achromobacter ruhlandii]NMU88612.1 hypothetical protein [Achromobacter ruhlandii]CUJ30080.1 Uncharacterised protein [Achromobacter ruhlandii]CUK16068.1 Uncharacterised protein [Achromobacter ruhlandii]